MLAMDRIGDPQVSPDGSRIVFVLRTTDLEANRGRTDLWLVGSDRRVCAEYDWQRHTLPWFEILNAE